MESVGLSNFSDSEDEELIPSIATYMAQENNCMHIAEALNIITRADTAEPQTLDPLLENEEEGGPQLGNPDWQALIKFQPVDLKI